jgi:hypothetical protein
LTVGNSKPHSTLRVGKKKDY